MDSKKVIKILEKAQARGAAVQIDIEKLPVYKKYRKERLIEKKIKYGIALTQDLINASNLDRAEKILRNLENIADEERYMGAIWEKRGWIADCRDKWNDEIEYFKKAKEIYESIPDSVEIEGHSKDRILTVDHFTARALYFRGKKSDLLECERLFNANLAGYKKLKSDDAIGFNYSWLARTYIAMGKLKKAKESSDLAEKYFDKAVKTKGENIRTYIYRIRSELSNAKGHKEEAVQFAAEALRYTLPERAYYNGVIEAVKCIIEASF